MDLFVSSESSDQSACSRRLTRAFAVETSHLDILFILIHILLCVNTPVLLML